MFRTITTTFHAWRKSRVAVRELSRLSDRELNDLGIGRDDIVAIVRQTARVQGA